MYGAARAFNYLPVHLKPSTAAVLHMDELDLPPLSQSAIQAAQTPPRPSLWLARKRTRSDYDDDPATSSDPALFSSDEQAPGAENYTAGKRKKRTFRGSWWDRHPVKAGSRKSTRKREFKRNYDSGIFMGSEASEASLSSDSFSMEDELLKDQQESRKPDLNVRWRGSLSTDEEHNITARKLAPKATISMPREYEAVCAIVRECLEKGKEDVDLS